MRRPEGYTTIKTGDMSSHTKSPARIEVDSDIDQMMKILGSPLSTRRKPGIASKTFAVPLVELVERQSDDTNIPVVVRRLCEFLKTHGLGHEGLFRLNGNVKIIDSLKKSFDKLGDANLEEAGDVVAAASLLKMFLRELPEPIIPKYLHLQFVQVQEENNDDNDDCMCHLRQLIEQLPETNFCTLRYLTSFLTRVVQSGHENRMTPTALGIVFGPNLFRVSEDMEGLRQQSLTNQLVTRFINNFSTLFDAQIVSEVKTDKINIRQDKDGKSSSSKEIGDMDDSSSSKSIDSDNDFSSSDSTTSPTVAVVATEFVDMAISKSSSSNNDRGISKTSCGDERKIVPLAAHDKNSENKMTELNGNHISEYVDLSARDTVHPATPDVRRRDWYASTFDDEYHEIKRSMERSQLFQRVPKSRKIRRNVRKSQSLGSLENEIDFTDRDSLKENDAKVGSESVHGRNQHVRSARAHCSQSLDLDAVTVTERPSHPFLELHPQSRVQEAAAASSAVTTSTTTTTTSTCDVTQTPSPNAGHKSYMPPLDLSILHEHGDGSEPIPINRARLSWPLMHSEKEENDVILSPRTAQLKKKISANLDPNVPPSPPVEQDVFVTMNMKEDEALTTSVKHLNKRIYHLKRKIKQFEESFESEFGYKPSHAEKMSRSDIKKHISELNKARRHLKQCKEDFLQIATPSSVGTKSDSLLITTPLHDDDDETASYTEAKKIICDETRVMEESLREILQELAMKRHVAHRPEDLNDMNQQEVHDEKIAIQKSLLQFESIFGRPSTKPEMDMMRPIYDRYRSVKRLMSKLGSPKAKDPGTELEPILEHEAMDFIQASPQHKPGMEESLSSGTDPPSLTSEIPDLKKAKKSHSSRPLNSSNLHELNTFELLEQHRKVKEEKKRLRRILHEFESEFQRQTGSQVKREDRTPLESIYGEYKQVKAKLRLLEALLSKHKPRYTV